MAGVGGASLRPGSYDAFPFVAVGFSTMTTPRVQHGFARVDVAGDQISVSYIGAADGAVLDRFTLTVPEPAALWPPAMLLLSVCRRRRHD